MLTEEDRQAVSKLMDESGLNRKQAIAYFLWRAGVTLTEIGQELEPPVSYEQARKYRDQAYLILFKA